MLLMKIYKREAGLLVAVCDKDLAGKTLSEGDIEVTISNHFYGDRTVSKAEVFEALRAAFAGNFFGEKAVAVAIESGLVDKAAVKTIDNVPHAQFIRMEIA